VHWIAAVAWGAALLVALLVLGYCAYEISGKAKRLRADVRKLEAVTGELSTLSEQLASARERVAQAGRP
jgi:hypothetical protein